MDPNNRDKLFKKIEELSTITLRDDPAEHGLSDMSLKLSEIVNKHSSACVLANKIIKIFGEKQQALNSIKSLYKIKYNNVLASNELVKQGGSQAERVAIATSLLQAEQQKLTDLQNEVTEWEGIKECIDNAVKTLVIAKESMSKQQQIIMQQISIKEIGTGFGSR